MPYSNHIENIDTTSEANAVRFKWRGDTFRVSTSDTMMVESVKGTFLYGDNEAILVETLLQKQRIV